MQTLTDIQAAYNKEIRPIKEKYREPLMENLRELAKPIFESGVSLIKWNQINDCYNDEDYYFGVQGLEFYGLDGQELYDESGWYWIIERAIDRSEIFQQIIGEASIQMTPSSYAISTESEDEDYEEEENEDE